MAIKHIRGDTWRRTWVLRDAAGGVIDLAGASARLHVRDEVDGLKIEATTVNGRLTVTPADGRIDLLVPAAQMVLDPARYSFDLELTYADGTVQTIEQDALVILVDRTHD